MDSTLSELAYEKIWEGLSSTDQKVLKAVISGIRESDDGEIKIEDVRKAVNMSSDSFTKYRKRLIDSGIIDGDRYGYLKMMLPRFEHCLFQ